MINTNGLMITWPQTEISGLQAPWHTFCLELRPDSEVSQQLLLLARTHKHNCLVMEDSAWATQPAFHLLRLKKPCSEAR